MASDGEVHAVVLAGGRGTRLAPYTMAFPKPLVPIGEIPIIEIVLRQLSWFGIKDATISVGHLASLIEAYFVARGAIPGIRIDYVRESKALGTAGALGLLAHLGGDLLVVNGDILTTCDFGKLIAFHKDNQPALTVGVHRKQLQIDLGVLELEPDGRVKAYLEKPLTNYECSMGINLYSKKALRLIGENERLDFPDLVLRLLEAGETVLAYQSDCYWQDIGRHEDYEMAASEFDEMRELLLPDEKAFPRVDSANNQS